MRSVLYAGISRGGALPNSIFEHASIQVPAYSAIMPSNVDDPIPRFEDIKSRIDRLGHSKLRTFTDNEHRFWIEQNTTKDSR